MSQASVKKPAEITRQNLLERAFEEIHREGFRGASLDAILKSSGVTKGALYHHFRNKAELGYAVVDEVVRPWVRQNWEATLHADNCIDAGIELCRTLTEERTADGQLFGCPFNNLINEMCPLDEGFRERLLGILEEWRTGLEQAMRQGIERGHVRNDVAPEAAAAFVISAIEGCIGMAKASQSMEFLDSGMRGLIDYLEHLRAEPCPNHAEPKNTKKDAS